MGDLEIFGDMWDMGNIIMGNRWRFWDVLSLVDKAWTLKG